MSRVSFDSWGRQEPLRGSEAAEQHFLKDRQAILENPAAGARIAAVMAWDGILMTGDQVDLFDLLTAHLRKVQSVSCGKCYPCRVGTAVILRLLEDGGEQGLSENGLAQIERIGRLLQGSSLCGLGCSTAKPVLDAVHHHRDRLLSGRTGPGAEYLSILSAPCQNACPIHQPIPDYLDTIRDGRCLESMQHILTTNPLPNILGRVCPHPCEDACVRDKVDEAISICRIKRFAADRERYREQRGQGLQLEARIDPEKPKVAVVGAGPAGVTAAWDLALMGYPVTIFEQYEVVSGTCWLGIPSYRAPRDTIWDDVNRLKALGVEIKLNTPVGPDLTLDDLRSQGYKAIFLGVGALRGKQLRVPGEEDFEGVLDCVEFLRRINLDQWEGPLPKHVVTVGAGDSAMDAARAAIRLGCAKSTVLYRRAREQAPAHSWELEEAEEEKVDFRWLASPKEILGKDGKVTGILAQRMELGPPDDSGRRRPVPIEGDEFVLECDMVVPAISQEPDLDFLGPEPKVPIGRWSNLEVDMDTFQSEVRDIFSGGDAVTGPKTAVEAMGHAHSAARSIHHYLSGRDPGGDIQINIQKVLDELFKVEKDAFVGELPKAPRVKMEHLDPMTRRCDFREFELGFTPQEATRETDRCLKCYRVATFLVTPMDRSNQEE